MVAMSFLLAVRARDHRGLDGDRQAAGDRRRTRRAGAQRRMAARDFLVPRGMGEPISPHTLSCAGREPRGRKSRRRHCGKAIEAPAVLWPDRAIDETASVACQTALGEDWRPPGLARGGVHRANERILKSSPASPSAATRHRNAATNACRVTVSVLCGQRRGGRRRSRRARRLTRAEHPTEDEGGQTPAVLAAVAAGNRQTEQRQRHLARQRYGGISCTAWCTQAVMSDGRRPLRLGRISPNR